VGGNGTEKVKRGGKRRPQTESGGGGGGAGREDWGLCLVQLIRW